MNRCEQEAYEALPRIAKGLERIAKALETMNINEVAKSPFVEHVSGMIGEKPIAVSRGILDPDFTKSVEPKIYHIHEWNYLSGDKRTCGCGVAEYWDSDDSEWR